MIVGLTGRKGSGKDTAAEVLSDYTPLKFAGILKAMTQVFLTQQGVSEALADRMVNGDLKEMPSHQYMGDKSPREFQQWLGTEFGRNLINQNIWVTCVMNQALLYNNVVFTDVRFPNEVEAVRKAGGVIIRIERNLPNGNYADHESERLIDTLEVDHVVENNGTVEELHDRVMELVYG